MSVKIGLELFEKQWPKQLKGAKVGLLVHPASVNKKLEHTVDLFCRSKKCQVTTLFGPQHGARGETQDNMIEWEDYTDSQTGLPVYSLYGKTRKPQPAMLDNLDVMVIDLQDVGARYYTFIWTMELCMQACLAQGKSIIVLDRPNPIGGDMVEGPLLDPHYASFVGNRALPVRHGLTIGEIAAYLCDTFYPTLDLYVIHMEGWRRKMWFDETGLSWVMPSPNMPTLETSCVYPGMCLLEGTFLSEGRGTTRPFEIFGAPFINPELLVKKLAVNKLKGVTFRPLHFLPTFQKHAGEMCGGAQLHITNKLRFKPFKTAVAILQAIHDLYPDQPLWHNPPYEYETIKMPIDILAGTDRLRRAIDHNDSLEHMETWWREECEYFDKRVRRQFLMYA